MERPGFCLPFGHRTSHYRKDIALAPFRQDGILFVLLALLLLVPHGTPAVLLDHITLRHKLRTATFRFNCRHILDALLGECLQHTADDHVVNQGLLLGEQHRLDSGRQQRMMVGHFRIVHTAPRKLSHPPRYSIPLRIVPQSFQQRRNTCEHIFGDVTAARPRIGDKFRLIQFLCDGKGLLPSKAEPRIGILLQCSQVIQKRGILHCLLAFHGKDRSPSCFSQYIINFDSSAFYIPFQGGREFHYAVRILALRGEVGLEHILRDKPLVLPETGTHHRKCRCLHPSDGVSAAPCGHRKSLCTVDAYEPVGLTAGFRGKI